MLNALLNFCECSLNIRHFLKESVCPLKKSETVSPPDICSRQKCAIKFEESESACRSDVIDQSNAVRTHFSVCLVLVVSLYHVLKFVSFCGKVISKRASKKMNSVHFPRKRAADFQKGLSETAVQPLSAFLKDLKKKLQRGNYMWLQRYDALNIPCTACFWMINVSDAITRWDSNTVIQVGYSRRLLLLRKSW